MPDLLTPSICFITPSHVRDIERFAVLRQSIQLFAPDLPHIALVHTEDVRSFRARFGGQRQLTIIPTAQVLPLSVEMRRRKSGPRWLTARWLYRGRIGGWYAQQLAKIFALAECPYEAAVFLDSDVFICRPLTADYFHVNGQLKLFRRRAPNAECLDYDITTHEIMGNPLHRVTELYDYIYHPSCFRRSSAAALLGEFRRTRRSLVSRFLRQRRPSEYHLLGYAATVLEGGAGYHLIECDPEELHHSIRFAEDVPRLREEIQKMWAQPKPFALIQSTLGIEMQQIAAAFEQLARSSQPAPPASSPGSPPLAAGAKLSGCG